MNDIKKDLEMLETMEVGSMVHCDYVTKNCERWLKRAVQLGEALSHAIWMIQSYTPWETEELEKDLKGEIE